EEHVARPEVRQDRREVAWSLQRGARRLRDGGAQFVGDDPGQRRLPEPGWPREEHVVERLGQRPGRLHRYAEALLDLLLTDELVQCPGTQCELERLVHRIDRCAEDTFFS